MAFALLLAAMLALAVWYGRFALIDDAFIVFRYARNLVDGNGLVFNIGERVEGYTCFLWVILLCIPTALGFDPVVSSQVLGAGFASLTLLYTTFFAQAASDRPIWARLVAPALLALNASVVLWAVHGLETAAFMAWLTVAVASDARGYGDKAPGSVWPAVWYAAAALTRPEGALLFAASCLFRLWAAPRHAGLSLLWKRALVFALVAIPFEAWRLLYYGDWLPNTYHAKVAASLPMAGRGLTYLSHFFLSAGGVLFLAVFPALPVARRDRQMAFLFWIATCYLLFVLLEGGDAFPAWRFLVPIFPILFLLAQEGLYQSARQLSRLRRRARTGWAQAALPFVLPIAFLAAAGLHLRRSFQEAERERAGGHAFTSTMKSVGLCLGRNLPRNARIALNPAGAVPYYSGLYAYDMLGLTNRHVSRTSVPTMGAGFAGHEKGNGAYILDQRPEIILFGNVTVVPVGPVDLRTLRFSATHRSEFEIARDPRTPRMYVLDQLPLGDGQYVVFLRRQDFALSAPRAQPRP